MNEFNYTGEVYEALQEELLEYVRIVMIDYPN